MREKRNFRIKIIVISLLLVSLIISTGYIAYYEFSGIIKQIGRTVRLDKRIDLSYQIIDQVKDAENNVKSYEITNDTVYLHNYYQSYDSCLLKVEELKEVNSKSEVSIDEHILDSLIHDKFNTLSLLLDDKTFRSEEVIKSIEKEINQNNNEKKNFLDKLFKKKISYDEINEKVDLVEKEQLKIETYIKNKKFALWKEDMNTTIALQNLFNEFIVNEQKTFEKNVADAERKTSEANQKIALTSLYTVILMLILVFIIISNIRRNNDIKNKLFKAKKEAEELAKQKQGFLANISHEIRTPLNAINGFVEVLSESELNEKQREQIDIINNSVNHLLHIVNDFLDFSKINEGKLKLEKTQFNPQEVIQEVEKLLCPIALQKNLEFKTQFIQHKNSLTPFVEGDPFRLKQILFNLLSNSIKFTSKGKVQLIARVKKHSESKASLCLFIQDDGIGMSKETLSKVFEEYQQGTEDTTRLYGGTGLGMSIVQKIIHMHNGSLRIQSYEGIGTKIIIKIMYDISQNAIPKGSTPSLNTSEKKEYIFQKEKVLIVDDEEYNLKLLKAILEHHQLEIDEANNGKIAVEKAAIKKYDVVLMDSKMPIMDGVTASKQIRNLDQINQTKTNIVVLSAGSKKEEEEKYSALGIQGVIAKPFKKDALLNKLEQLFSETKTAMNQNQAPTIDFSDLKDLSQGNNEFYMDMLQTFIKTSKEGMALLDEGIKKESYNIIRETSHKLLSPCKHLSADVLYNLLKEIEDYSKENHNLNEISELYQLTEIEYNMIEDRVKEEINSLS